MLQGGCSRAPVINRSRLSFVGNCSLAMRYLQCCWREMLFVCRSDLGCRRSCRYSAGPAIIAYSVNYCRISNNSVIYVGIMDNGSIYTNDGGVVSKYITMPATTNKTNPYITKAIVYTPVKSNRRSPITMVKAVISTEKSPGGFALAYFDTGS